MCATRSGDSIDAIDATPSSDATPIDGRAGSAHFGAVRDPAEEPLVAAREVEAVAPGYGEDEEDFMQLFVLRGYDAERERGANAGA